MRKLRPTGKLNQPIEIILNYPKWSGPGSMMTPNVGELRRAHSEMLNRLDLLFPYYCIERTGDDTADFQRLAVRLAGEVFPGFRIKEIDPKQYQHRRSNPLTLLLLLADVQTIKREKARRTNRLITDGEAIEALIKDRRYRGLKSIWGDRDIKTLLNWLSDARNPAKNRFLADWRECEAENKLDWIMAMINWIARGQSRALRMPTGKPGNDRSVRAARGASLKLMA